MERPNHQPLDMLRVRTGDRRLGGERFFSTGAVEKAVHNFALARVAVGP